MIQYHFDNWAFLPLLAMLTAPALLAVACMSTDQNAANHREGWDKMDAPLRSEIRRLMDSNDLKIHAVPVLLQMTENNDELAGKLEETGFRITGRHKTVWTGRGTAEVIVRVAELDFVKRLELSRERMPTDDQ